MKWREVKQWPRQRRHVKRMSALLSVVFMKLSHLVRHLNCKMTYSAGGGGAGQAGRRGARNRRRGWGFKICQFYPLWISHWGVMSRSFTQSNSSRPTRTTLGNSRVLKKLDSLKAPTTS